MKIAIDGHPLIPPRAGIGQYTYHLIKALARLEPAHQYIVMYPRLTRTLRTREGPIFAEKCVRVVSEGRTGVAVGFKPAGGIRAAKQALLGVDRAVPGNEAGGLQIAEEGVAG